MGALCRESNRGAPRILIYSIQPMTFPFTTGRARALSIVLAAALAALPQAAHAAQVAGPAIGPIPFDFILFAMTLLGVALFHRHTLRFAVCGMLIIVAWKVLFSPFAEGPGVSGFIAHLGHEWVLLANLLGLLLGFELLSKHFEYSQLPAWLPKLLPDDWKGAFALLVVIFVLSSFLDNIAAAMIGGTVAGVVFRHKLHIGYLAAIVAASNAGGSGSVVGDTTTTMLWIGGVPPFAVIEAYAAAVPALLLFGIPASLQQQRYSPIVRDAPINVHIDWVRVFIVAFMLAAAISVNVYINLEHAELGDRFPFIGAAVWVALLICVPLRTPAWRELPGALRGSMFLLSLVLAASMMPVRALPDASWHVTLGLGFVSAVFDNIPLTALALHQGGYDWGLLAYAVGFGGSMVWFGSSAGVALSNLFPESRSVAQWIRNGWHVALAYVIGFLIMLALTGWEPEALRRAPHPPAVPQADQPSAQVVR